MYIPAKKKIETILTQVDATRIAWSILRPSWPSQIMNNNIVNMSNLFSFSPDGAVL